MARNARPIHISAQAIESMPEEAFADAATGGNVTWKTLLSSGQTPSDTFTAGLARCTAGGGHLKCHRHTHPEIYHVVQGRGKVTIDGQEHDVAKGSVVFIPGDSEHGIRNDDARDDLVWLYVFAADKFEDVVYRFSEEKPKAKL